MSKAMRQDDSAQKPLSGRRVVVTRARAQAESLARRIEELGGQVIEFPTIEIRPPESFAAFDAAVEKIDSYDWLIFTSINSIEPFLVRLQQKGKTVASLKVLKVGAIGPETAKRLEEAEIRVCLVPKRYQAEGLLEAVEPETMRGKRVLIPRAAEAREILPNTLRQWGAFVDVVIAYRTMLPAVASAPLAELLHQRKVDVITFTSPSTVRNFVRLFNGKNLGEITAGSALACIGPITSRTVEQLGGHADLVASEFTIPGMMRAIVAHFGSKPDAAKEIPGRRIS
jgi:uroporphyrinogen III methyltransferase/synthase